MQLVTLHKVLLKVPPMLRHPSQSKHTSPEFSSAPQSGDQQKEACPLCYAREAILEHLDDLEDLHLAEQRLIDVQSGKTQSVSLEEVMNRYDLEG